MIRMSKKVATELLQKATENPHSYCYALNTGAHYAVIYLDVMCADMSVNTGSGYAMALALAAVELASEADHTQEGRVVALAMRAAAGRLVESLMSWLTARKDIDVEVLKVVSWASDRLSKPMQVTK